ncbi:PilZ domain-containing protein [Agrobacterium vitis]|uniref:PilZ domain-containing protein n=2 Tax=Agrobacterium vitis TaxID=373 RepID=A0A368P0I5_AGRVI|nr:PilZ domain-containing protein [Agrobacterium vitis]KAA3527958.1 PilZ domain-containing protein [Agrobacterium vitis]MCF1478505.1 PilZ domain-containing protein [Agrobacterium vitis]MUZ96666.1 PilZ domain-containing protein [Agrobacterium vitis]MVA28481.1 PilZ domain-containing protein [Agrobacterium vitis]
MVWIWDRRGFRMENKRRDHRVRTLQAARIILKNGFSSFSCTVKNISSDGAKLAGDNFVNVPDEFDLLMDGGRKVHCVVRWRKITEIGVEFV